MAKKNFNDTFNRVMGKAEDQTQQPAEVEKKAQAKAQTRAKNYNVVSFRMEQETIDKIKDYAYTKRISIKEAVTLMVDTFIDDYNDDPSNEPLLPHRD